MIMTTLMYAIDTSSFGGFNFVFDCCVQIDDRRFGNLYYLVFKFIELQIIK